ncbi:MAG: NADH-quinone oxidoreductase subunit C, partial [Bryobacteraceae bacterium]
EFGELTLYIDPARIVSVCAYLKHAESFVRASSVTALDWYPLEPRFEIVYLLHSLERNERVRLKCKLSGENPEIDSVCSVWRGADWYEREVFDLFGVKFRNHPDLRRILMPENWEGHPLRKDYPIHGSKYSYQDE